MLFAAGLVRVDLLYADKKKLEGVWSSYEPPLTLRVLLPPAVILPSLTPLLTHLLERSTSWQSHIR